MKLRLTLLASLFLALSVEAQVLQHRRKAFRAVVGGEAPSSASWDGSNSRMAFSGSVVSMSDTASGITISFWVDPDSFSNGPVLMQGRNAAGGPQWRINISAAGNINFIFLNNASTTVIQGDSDPLITTTGWYHVMMSFSTASTATRHVYINGAEASFNWNVFLVGNTLDLAHDSFFIGGDDSFGSDFFGCISQLRVKEGYLDLSVAGNRAMLYSGGTPVNLGTDGNGTGAGVPEIFMRFIAGSLGVNSGSDAGTATIVGGVTAGDCGAVGN